MMPALYIGHGAPILLEDPIWTAELAAWARNLPRPKAILIVSAHWESAPLMAGAVEPTNLIYDFGGFAEKYYRLQYPSPGAPALLNRLAALMPDDQPLHHAPSRGLDHGAYIPLMVMYPEADIPVLQMSIPSQDPVKLIELGRRLQPLREEGILIIGSGFLTHGLPFIRHIRSFNDEAPNWSKEFDSWANQLLVQGDVESLMDFRRAPGFSYAHPTLDHLLPMYVTLGASSNPEQSVQSDIEGFWLGLSKRSFAVA